MLETTSDPEQWLEHHGDALFRYARSRVRDDATAEDLVQETLLAALKGRQNFRGAAAERTWLIAILRNKLIDHLRRHQREICVTSTDDDEGDAVVDAMFKADGHWRRAPGCWEANPDELTSKLEFWAIYETCRAALPAKQAAVFTLRLCDGVEPDVLCQELGLTPTNLWVLLHRARLRLRACLEAKWFGSREKS